MRRQVVVNECDDLPLTLLLDKLTELSRRNGLSAEGLVLYRGLCALEASVLYPELVEQAEAS